MGIRIKWKASILFLMAVWVLPLIGQENPFDLVPRLELEAQAAIEGEIQHPTGNVFDVVPPPKSYVQQRPYSIVELQEESPKAPDAYRGFLFSVTLFLLIVLTLLVTLFRSVLTKVYNSFLNENILNQVYRDRDSVGVIPYWILYFLFFLNAGFFIFLLIRIYGGVSLSGGYFIQLLKCVGGVSAVFLFKHFLLSVIAYVFPVEKEAGKYSFTIMIFSIVIGILLAPANLILAYTAPDIVKTLAKVIFAVLIGVYLFRSLRGLMIANKYLAFHKFHFLLYICTVEIAPVMVLLKLLMG